MPPRINMSDVTLQQMNEYLMINNERVPLTRLEDMLLDLYDLGIMSHDDYRLYISAINRIRFDGEMPGLTRFPIPCCDGFGRGMQMFFLPALRVIMDNYLLPPEQIQTIRLGWDREVPENPNPFEVVSEDFAITRRRGEYWIVDVDGDMVGFGDIARDLDAIEFTFANPDRPVSPLGLDEFPFDPNDVPTEHFDAAQILYRLWQRGNDGMTADETDGELSNDDTEMGEFVEN